MFLHCICPLVWDPSVTEISVMQRFYDVYLQSSVSLLNLMIFLNHGIYSLILAHQTPSSCFYCIFWHVEHTGGQFSHLYNCYIVKKDNKADV